MKLLIITASLVLFVLAIVLSLAIFTPYPSSIPFVKSIQENLSDTYKTEQAKEFNNMINKNIQESMERPEEVSEIQNRAKNALVKSTLNKLALSVNSHKTVKGDYPTCAEFSTTVSSFEANGDGNVCSLVVVPGASASANSVDYIEGTYSYGADCAQISFKKQGEQGYLLWSAAANKSAVDSNFPASCN